MHQEVPVLLLEAGQVEEERVKDVLHHNRCVSLHQVCEGIHNGCGEAGVQVVELGEEEESLSSVGGRC